MNTISIGDRIKLYEVEFTGKKINSSLPYVIRLDGHSFSKFTRGLEKPYDYNFHKVFSNTAMYLMKEYQADTAYTHSDEISLLFYTQRTKKDDNWKEPLYDGRIQKMNSICAAMCTMFFNKELVNTFSSIKDQYLEKITTYDRMMNSEAYFDCRIFQLPTDTEMFSYIFFRSQIDCRRNHVFGLSRKHFTKSELNSKSTEMLISMLKEKGIDWNNEPACFRRGSFFKRVRKPTENNSIRFEFKEIEIDLSKFDDEINQILKCEIYDQISITNNSEEKLVQTDI
jgi:tRNA(His) 5'-end guanylyltransferase